MARTTSSNPRFHTSRSSVVAASTHAVEALLFTPATWPQWQPELLDADGPAPLAAGDAVAGTASMLGFRVAGRATVLEAFPGALEHEVVVGVRMRVRYDVVEHADGSRLIHTLVADLPRGPLGRLLSVFLRGRLRRMQRDTLTGIARTARDATGRSGEAPAEDRSRGARLPKPPAG